MVHKITRPIYIRKGPGKGFDRIGVAQPGDDYIQMDGTVTGEALKGLDQWHYKINDLGEKNYYWQGGTVAQLHWSLRFFGIDEIWKHTKGEGIKIAIIDSGVNVKNTDLVPFAGFNVIDKSLDVQDDFYHGTYCSTIACSKGQNGIYGVAPMSDLLAIKIANCDEDISNVQFQIDGIRKAVEMGARVLSMSFGKSKENPELTELLKRVMNSGIICIAASGNNRSLPVEFPANIKGMISIGNVGCFNPNAPSEPTFLLSNFSSMGGADLTHEGVTLVAPGNGLSTYGLNENVPVTNIDGTSFATPYVAGLAALWLGANRSPVNNKNAHHDFKKVLIETATKNIKDYDPKTCGVGLVNPSLIISNHLT